jgi:hypothetical protein
MLKQLLSFTFLVFSAQAATVEEAIKQCEVSITVAKKQISDQDKRVQALVKVISKQHEASTWLVKGPPNTYKGSDSEKIKLAHKLEYKDGLYYIQISGKIKRYDVQFNKNTNQYDVIEVPDYDILLDIKGIHDFKPGNVHPRPYSYFPSIFKFGGIVIPSLETRTVKADIALMYEFFSFDRAFNFYGWSLNASVGIRHVGALFGYQFLNVSSFSNTNLVIGYAYDFLDKNHTPVIGLSLNF